MNNHFDFYPRPPRGGRPRIVGSVDELRDFYPRPPRGGRLFDALTLFLPVVISIHALREEGDQPFDNLSASAIIFLSTPSARRATTPFCTGTTKRRIFLSTPSARRATASRRWHRRSNFDFYPRPPRGGRPDVETSAAVVVEFCPRPPRGGRLFFHVKVRFLSLFLSTPSARRATPPWIQTDRAREFLSTPSARRATAADWFRDNCYLISIHALREEGD